MEQKAGKLALYLRLSQEDSGEKESESIQNQRELLNRFVSENAELAGYEREEFVDDGWSGTNFDRPAMQTLLGKVRRGEISCMVVKDFSRFGRSYIETGTYLERIFPVLGVRFLSVNDHYDSAARLYAGAGLELAFRNLLYDLYSKDLSQKVKSGRAVKAKAGKFTSRAAPFGYQKSPSDKNRLLIGKSAPIVQKIFQWAAAGNGCAEIARRLAAAEIPTPSGRSEWSSDAVTRILRDERYTGKMISGKRERLLGENTTVKIPREQWLTAAETHEPIVTETLFQAAQNAMAPFREINRERAPAAPLHGLVLCGNCGHPMRRRAGSAPYYRCENGCKTRVGESELEQLLRRLFEGYGTLKRGAAKSTAGEKAERAAKREIRRIQAARSREICSDYEAFCAGRITEEAYRVRREKAAKREKQTPPPAQSGRGAAFQPEKSDRIRLEKLLLGVRVVENHRIELAVRLGDFNAGNLPP